MTVFDKRSRNAPSKLRQMGLAIGRRDTPLTEMFPSAFGKAAGEARVPAPFTPAAMETPWRGAVTPVAARSPAQNVPPPSTYGAAMSFAQSGAQNTARPVPADPWRQRGAVTPDDRMRRTLHRVMSGEPAPESRPLTAAEIAASYGARGRAFVASGKERIPDQEGRLYDPANPDHHWYEHWTPLGDFSSDLLGAAFQSLLRHAAPGQSSISGSGEPVEAITPFGSLGFIDQVVDPASRSVTNHTQKNHRLYPGSVRRSVVVKDGKVWIRTIGEGIGPDPQLNELLAFLVWGGTDASILEDLARIREARMPEAKQSIAFRRQYPDLLARHGDPGFVPPALSVRGRPR